MRRYSSASPHTSAGQSTTVSRKGVSRMPASAMAAPRMTEKVSVVWMES